MENQVAADVTRRLQKTDSSERALKKFDKNEPYEPKKPVFNRSTFSPDLRAKIKDYVTQNPTLTLVEYIRKIPLTCKPPALCKLLVKMDLRCYKAPRKEFLTRSHKEMRIIKAREWVSCLFQNI